MKPLITLFSGLLVAGNLLPAQDAKILNDSFLSGIRTEAARTHPAAVAGKLRAKAAAQDVRAVRLWDDPMVGLSFMAAERMMREDDGDIMLGFEQPLPKPGLYAANREKAEAMRRAEAETSRSAALEAGTMAAKNAIELALADESVTLQESQVQWLNTMAENARQRAVNPDGSSIEALRLDSEVTREKQILDAAKRTRESMAQKLNLSLGRPLETRWPTLRLPPAPPPVPVAASEIARIPHANPNVRAMKETASVAQAERRITEREKLPEVSVGVETNLYSGGDYRSSTFGIKMTLPWLNEPSYAARTDAARTRETAAVADIEVLRREIAASVLSATTEAANAAAQARAYSGDVYGKTLQATQTIESSWITSKATLTELLESNRILFSIRLEQRRFIAMQLAALEELNLLVPRKH
jgi:outer membrane protein, heavy metal efflux system